MKRTTTTILSVLLWLCTLPQAHAFEAATDTLRIAFMTDIHISEGSPSALEDLDACIADINSQAFDLVLIGGDLTNFGTDREFCIVREHLDKIVHPWHAVAGNHDLKWSESGCNGFKRHFGTECLEFHLGGWRFIGCNSGPDMRMAPALVPQFCMEFLKGLPAEKTIFINHYPINDTMLNYGELRAELARIDTRFCLGGHFHTNMSFDYGNGLKGAVMRSTLRDREKGAGYSIITLTSNEITIAEKRPREALREAWIRQDLSSPCGVVSLDENLLPEDYPWTKFDVNEKWPQVKELWHIHLPDNIASGFALDERGRRAYFATEEGTLYSINIKNGKLRKIRELGQKTFSTAAYSDGKLILGSDYVDFTLASPVVRDGVVYLGTSEGKFYAFDQKTKQVLWQFEGVEGFVECRPWVDGQVVIFGAWDRNLYCLNRRSGDLLWKWTSPKTSNFYSPAACNPVRIGEKVFFAAPDRKAYCLDVRDGSTIAEFEGGRECVNASLDMKKVYVKTMHNHVYAIDVKSCKVLWTKENALGYDISPTSPIEIPGCLVVPSDKGCIVGMEPSTGELLWQHKISLALVNPITWIPGTSRILCSTMDGHVVLMEIGK